MEKPSRNCVSKATKPQKRRKSRKGAKSRKSQNASARPQKRHNHKTIRKAQPSRTLNRIPNKTQPEAKARKPNSSRNNPAAPSHRKHRSPRQQAPDAGIEHCPQQGNRKHRTSQQASTKTYKLSTTVPLREISGADCAIQGAYCIQTVPLKRTRCYVSFVTQ